MRYDTPFPHLVWDWSDYPIGGVRDEFPAPKSPLWQIYDNNLEQKRACAIPQGPHTKELIRTLSRPEVPEFIASEFGIGGELSMSLEGGGYHWLPAGGGKLGMHVDFNVGSDGLYRRANVLLYLNPGWQDGDGGELVLAADREGTRFKVIPPTWGTVVAFPTGENTWHGNPNPCRVDRYSFAMYLFSTEPPPDYPGAAHSTVFQ
jgi:hypothetical protein